MKLHRFIGSINLEGNKVVITDLAICHQIARVLKLRAGENIGLCDGAGLEVVAVIDDILSQTIVATVIKKIDESVEQKGGVILFCSLLKKENFELVVEKATEVGVSRIVPIISGRTIKLGAKIERWKIIAKEAGEQCGRTRLPIIENPVKFAEAVKIAKGKKFFLNMGGTKLKTLSKSDSGEEFSVFVGPEGGWTSEEEQMAKDAGCEEASLGSLTFRAETAAIVAVYLCANTI